MTVQYEVIVDRIGGADVITCNAFSVRNLELMGQANEEDIKKTIFRQCHIDAEDERADCTIRIIDNRPAVEENYTEVQERESKKLKGRKRQKPI